jgi:TolB-like protein/Tfp pilus assembly protein PilF/DNA-binding winged helix-turn-helix (wHTH) protein
MAVTDLQAGFSLNDWLVEPRERRISGAGGTQSLTDEQVTILLALAEHHGETVGADSLRARLWPDGTGDADALHDRVHRLQAVLGDAPDAPRFIRPAGSDGYALVARPEPTHGASSAARTPGATRAPGAAQTPKAFAPRFTALLLRLIDELRRRHVLKVAVGYLVAAWLVLQVAETTFEPLHLPAWWMSALTIVVVIGFPVVTVLAWLYDITPAGIVADASGGGIALPRPRRSLAPWIVAGVAAMALVTGLAWWRTLEHTPPGSAVGKPAFASIAVLPFIDLSPAGGDGGYLGDGLSEELSARLAQIRGLRVAARTSAFSFRDRNLDMREIGQRLGVRHVLEGSVRRAGDGLRVTVQLIDAETGYHTWSQNYDRNWRDLLLIQADIASSVTEALKGVLAPDASGPAPAQPPPDTRALEPYLAGLGMLGRSGDLGDLHQARAQFEAALAIDPSFARAHAGNCQVGVRIYGRTRDPADLAKAERHCQQALDLDATLTETEKALAALYNSGGQYVAASSILRVLLARNPDDADGYIGLGRSLEGLGQPAEAEREYRRAVAVEPAFWGAHNALGAFLLSQGRVDDAAASFQRVTELASASASAYNNLGAALQSAGKFERAAEAYRRSLAIAPSASAHSNLGTMHFYLGAFAEAVEEYRAAAALAGENMTMWGNLADALWRLPDGRGEAVTTYRRAIALAERDLELAPDDALVAAQLGYYYGRVGDAVRARGRLEHALRAGADSPFVNYYAALAAADGGDRARAAARIQEAIRLGYPAILAQADPALKGIPWRADAAKGVPGRAGAPGDRS